jgi:hypothetical protein
VDAHRDANDARPAPRGIREPADGGLAERLTDRLGDEPHPSCRELLMEPGCHFVMLVLDIGTVFAT